jgi:hypothetical protein
MRSGLTLIEGRKRFGGNKKRIGCPFCELAPERVIKAQSYI